MILSLRRRTLDLADPVVMGVLNVTPDSFSDGGRYSARDVALRRALEMLDQGAGIIDIGGESTRPGAQPVSEQEELDRVLPAIEALRAASDCVISVDTMKPGVMRAACAAGADIINDIMALCLPGALDAVRETGAAAVLMHMQGEPRTMQRQPQYRDVVRDVGDFFAQRLAECARAGIGRERLLLDPGFGFGKTFEHNLQLLARLDTLAPEPLPLLVGLSRKTMLGRLGALPLDSRLAPGIAAAAVAVWLGAAVVRTHDVRETVEALRLTAALRTARIEPPVYRPCAPPVASLA